MAQDDNYKEGVDFEWVIMKNQPKGGTNKTRHFFTKAEKDAMKAPKAAAKTKTKAKAKAKPATNAVRPEGKPAGMPKAPTNAVRPEAKPAGMPKAKAKPFILGRFGPLGAVRPSATAKPMPKATTGAKANYLKGKK